MTSPKSARVSSVRSLYDRRHRAERGAFVVEGPQAVEAAVSAGRIRELYITESAQVAHPHMAPRALQAGARVAMMTDAVARAMSETEHPQGVIAVCDLVTTPWSIDLIATGGRGVIVVLDRISDPGNAGTIIRTSDAAGVAAVVFTPGSVDPHNGKCVRSTAGSIFHVPVCTDVDALQVIADAREAGAVCLAADGRGDVTLGTERARDLIAGECLWVFGSEAHGVAPDIAAAVDACVAIPIAGGAESLNLAAAAAICLYAPLISQVSD